MAKKAVVTLTMQVRMKLPEGANTQDALEYVRAAVVSYKGSFDPGAAMFDLDRETVKVSLLKKEVVYA